MTLVLVVQGDAVMVRRVQRAFARKVERELVRKFEQRARADRRGDRWYVQLVDTLDRLRRPPQTPKK